MIVVPIKPADMPAKIFAARKAFQSFATISTMMACKDRGEEGSGLTTNRRRGDHGPDPTHKQHEERKDVHVGAETKAVRSDGGQHLQQYLDRKVGPAPDRNVDSVQLEDAGGRITHGPELIDKTCRYVSVFDHSLVRAVSLSDLD